MKTRTASPAAEQASDQPVGLRSLPRQKVIITFVGVLMAMFLSSMDQTVVGTGGRPGFSISPPDDSNPLMTRWTSPG